MELTTSWMEQGLEQGLTQGLEQERRSNISSLMELRYGSIDEPLDFFKNKKNSQEKLASALHD